MRPARPGRQTTPQETSYRTATLFVELLEHYACPAIELGELIQKQDKPLSIGSARY